MLNLHSLPHVFSTHKIEQWKEQKRAIALRNAV